MVGLELSSFVGANHPRNGGSPGLLVDRRVHGKFGRSVGCGLGMIVGTTL